jgi:hypothetical protein
LPFFQTTMLSVQKTTWYRPSDERWQKRLLALTLDAGAGVRVGMIRLRIKP